MRRPLILLVAVLGIAAGSAAAVSAAMDPETRIQLARIQQDLETLKQGQQKILENQGRLSEEHKQLRYYVHRK